MHLHLPQQGGSGLASYLKIVSISTSLLLVLSSIATAQVDAEPRTGRRATERRPLQASDILVLRAGDRNSYTAIPSRFQTRAPQGAPTATFIVTYNGFPQNARTAFQYAIDQWANFIESPEPIRVQANWVTLSAGQLGSAGSNGRVRNFLGAPQDDTFYPMALADRLAGTDIGVGDFDIIANFNSSVTDWYFGTNGNTPGGKFDFVTVVMHELAHGLGFAGSMRFDDGNAGNGVECTGTAGHGCWGSGNPVDPNIYDRFTENGSGKKLLTYSNSSAALGTQLTGGNLFYDSPNTRGKNGGMPPKLYAPGTFEPGSSYSHFDETVFGPGDPDSLMTPTLDLAESIHDPGDIALCAFEDHGWETSANCTDGPAQGLNVLFNQDFTCGPAAGASFFYSDFSMGTEAADDFVVPAGQNWSIETIVVTGVFSVGGGPITNARVKIYRDNNSPGSVACSYNNITPTAGKSDPAFQFDLPSSCDLDPGTYWLSVQAVLPSSNLGWFWVEGPTSIGDEWEFRDTNDLFGSGCTSWKPHSQCPGIGGAGDDLCFGLVGDPGGSSSAFFQGNFESGNFSGWAASVP